MKTLLAAALLAGAFVLGLSPSGHRGAVADRSALGAASHPAEASAKSRASGAAGADMTYHGGWVMRTNTTYAIYWVPSASNCGVSDPTCSCGVSDPTCSSYESAINRYFKDVAAASGSDSNVYSVDTQYSDTTGPIAYQSTFGGSAVDHGPFPPYNPGSSCIDGSYPVCLTDQQVRAEIQNVITAVGWPDGKSSMFFLMTPDSVGECLDSSSNRCVGCGNHGRFTGSNSQPVVYAFIPYAATRGCAGIPLNPSPNGDAADATINVISHEHNEAITNPWGDAWYAGDTQQGEIGDLCAWNFGNPLGTAPNGQSYNEVINGHYYWLQQEWSNDGSTCLQRYVPGVVPPTSVRPPVVTGTAAVGKDLSTSNGGWAGNPTSYSYQWQHCTDADQLSTCSKIGGATAATYRLAPADAGFVFRAEVTAANAAGASAPTASATTAAVAPVLVATRPPSVSGVVAVGKTLSVTNGAWNAPVDSFADQWLRCAADGSGCTSIPGAASASYRIVDADAGHTLEVRVFATNAAGTAVALSDHTAAVVSKPAVTRLPRITGKVKTGRRLKASGGTWSGSPTSFHYQWLSCNARGAHCRPVRRATKRTYVLHAADVGHKLRVRVTVTNAAGPSTATSAATPRVVR